MPVPLVAAIPAIAQGVAGLTQSIFGGSRARRAEKALERLQTPTYEKSKGIGDYFTKALARYNVNPFQTASYSENRKQIDRGTATGISALQDRRSAIGGISKIIQAQNDASLKAAGQAEQEQAQAFGQLGAATQMQAGEEMKEFQYNKVAPYEKKLALLGAKAAGGNQMLSAGLQNIFGAASTAGQMGFQDYLMGKYYGK